MATTAVFIAPAAHAAPCTSAVAVGPIEINGDDGATFVGDSVNVRASVTSACQLQAVVAEAFGHSVSLSFDSGFGKWTGDLSLATVPPIPFGLTVSATDLNGAVATRTVNLIRDTPPSLFVTSPTEAMVARPSFHLLATCADDDPGGCQVSVSFPNGTPFVSGFGELDREISLQAYEGEQVELEFRAIDSRGQQAMLRRAVYVDSSPRLSEVVHVSGPILDDSSSRTLFLTVPGGFDSVPTVLEKATGAIVPLTLSTATCQGCTTPQGRVTNRGAIFDSSIATPYSHSLFEWRDGALVPLSLLLSGPDRFFVAGDYALFAFGDTLVTLVLRDLRAGTEHTIVENLRDSIWDDVSPNGDVVYWGADYQIYRYRDGITTQMTNSTARSVYPATDGVNIAYQQVDEAGHTLTTRLITDAGEIVLADFTGRNYSSDRPARDYDTTGGWTAFTRPIGADTNVWRRAPDGSVSQVSFFRGVSEIDALNSDGAITIRHGRRRWLAAPDGSLTQLSWSFGVGMHLATPSRSFWRDGTLYVIIGGSVFSVDRSPGTSDPTERPSLTNPGDRTNVIGTTVTPLQLVGSDPYGGTVTYTATGLPPGLTVQEGTGVITGTATAAGMFTVTASVLDSSIPPLSDSEVFRWMITPNAAPSLTNPGNHADVVGTAIPPLQLVGSDPDGGPVSYTAAGLPPGLTLQESTGLILGTGTTPGAFTVTATVRDGAVPSLTDAKTFTWTMTARSASVTVTPDSSSIGSTLTSAVANAPGNATDWVGLFAEGANDTSFVAGAWCYLNGTKTAPLTGSTSASVTCFTPSTGGRYEVRLFSNNSFTKVATSNTITVVNPAPPPGPAIALTPDPATVGASLTATVTGAPGHATDWVGLYQEGAVDTAFVGWCYLNGARTVPGIAITNASLPCFAPASAGRYQVRLFSSNSYTRLATSNTITVAGPAPPTGPSIALTPDPATVGTSLTAAVTTVSGSAGDWVGLFAEGAGDTAFISWCYLNGTKTAPTAVNASAAVGCFTPTVPGRYQVRLFSNNTFTKVATSNTITVPGPTVALTPDPSPAGGTLTAAVSGAPGNATDWVGLYREGATDSAFLSWCFLNSTRTAPATGATSASVTCFTPPSSGRYQVRLFSNNTFTKVTTSNTISVP